MSPFDTVHTTSYLPSIVTMSLSCASSEIWRVTGRKFLFFLPRAYLAPAWGDLKFNGISGRSVVSEKWTAHTIMWCWLHDATFRRFDKAAGCDRRMERQTRGRSTCRRTIEYDTKICFIYCSISLANCFFQSAVSECQPADSRLDAWVLNPHVKYDRLISSLISNCVRQPGHQTTPLCGFASR